MGGRKAWLCLAWMQRSQLPTEPHETHLVNMPSHTFDQD